MRRYFALFLLSGFCGLVYETVWVRLAVAQFGVTSTSFSIVVSLYMAGLAIGSWLTARLAKRWSAMDARRAGRLYAAAEVAIAVLGLGVPVALKATGAACAHLLGGHGGAVWYAGATLSLALVLLPATIAMGTTIPLGMHAIRKAGFAGSGTSFSYLYLANVLGAVAGTLLPTFILIELMGFRGTLLVAGVVNLGIAGLAFAGAERMETAPASALTASAPRAELATPGRRAALAMLFLTGFATLGMEVVWTRQFTLLVGTFVYSFASILAVYLVCTFAGSTLYRVLGTKGTPLSVVGWSVIVALAGLPLLATDPDKLWSFQPFGKVLSIQLSAVARVALGIGPFSAALGFITPFLVDHVSEGNEDRAGRAYALNTVGCILGPLLAGFVLLPNMSPRWALVSLTAPLWVATVFFALRSPARTRGILYATAAAATLAALTFSTHAFDEGFPSAQVRRDHSATTIAFGSGMEKRLVVNGVGMTSLTPITKMMAHLSLAMLSHPPTRALTICFGMGTTFRSLNTWDIDVTAVELVPGVPQLFPYFHPDAAGTLGKPGAHVVVDDGRRFLEMDRHTYDVIIIDPPPPVPAASSSLLYSVEFYRLAKQRLAPDGILQQWIPGGDATTIASMVRAITEVFPYLRAYQGQGFGVHLFASSVPIAEPVPAELAKKLNPAAAADLLEWAPGSNVTRQFAEVIGKPQDWQQLLKDYPDVPALTDDRPVNEYYVVRNALQSR